MNQRELEAALRGEFSEYEIIDVQIAGMLNGAQVFRTLPAVRLSDDWALHPTFEGIGYWTCTYIPSGLAINTWPTLAQALMALGVLLTLDLPWHLMNSQEECKAILDALPEAKKARARANNIIRGMAPTEVTI